MRLLLLVAAACIAAASAARSYDVMAIYFGDWHPDPDMEAYHGSGWT